MAPTQWILCLPLQSQTDSLGSRRTRGVRGRGGTPGLFQVGKMLLSSVLEIIWGMERLLEVSGLGSGGNRSACDKG
jgi:hypothetical protein